MSAAHFVILGVPNAPAERLPAQLACRLAEAEELAYTRRHASLVREHAHPQARLHPWNGSPEELLRLGRQRGQCITALASGDPLFFGVAGALRRKEPGLSLEVVSGNHCLQVLARRFCLPYEELRPVSLHGRNWQALDAALMRGEPLLGVLTDTLHTPAALASRLLEYGYSNHELFVGEELESSVERCRRLTLEEACSAEFLPLNCVLLRRAGPAPAHFGLDEQAFAGLPGRPNMVTKMPCRLALLARMQVKRRRVLWDIGFCTGSVSLEARLQNPDLEVHAFERRPECEALLQENSRRFGVPGIQAHMGDFFEQPLSRIAPPDAVFVGGHGGRLRELFDRVTPCLQPGGVILTLAVLPESREAFVTLAKTVGLRLGREYQLVVDGHKPVWLLEAHKGE